MEATLYHDFSKLFDFLKEAFYKIKEVFSKAFEFLRPIALKMYKMQKSKSYARYIKTKKARTKKKYLKILLMEMKEE